MKKFSLFFLLCSLLLLLSACAPTLISKKEAFPKMYDEHPHTILVLPPINATTAADAKEYYATTLAEPLSYAGYYILPIEVTSDILKEEGLSDTELILNTPPQKFKQYFGADAVLYTKILKWDTSYYVIGGHMTVAVDFTLKSTTTGLDLWKYDGQIVVDTSGNSGNSGGLAGLLVKMVVTAITTATADYVPIAKRANAITISSMPCGKYHPTFDKDREVKIPLKKASDETMK